jgi:hypothetical protein
MYTFYVVVFHKKSNTFSSLNYTTDNEILTESDLINIEDVHVERIHGMLEVTTQIISWQRLDVK